MNDVCLVDVTLAMDVYYRLCNPQDLLGRCRFGW